MNKSSTVIIFYNIKLNRNKFSDHGTTHHSEHVTQKHPTEVSIHTANLSPKTKKKEPPEHTDHPDVWERMKAPRKSLDIVQGNTKILSRRIDRILTY